jgi:hypothetical protein
MLITLTNDEYPKQNKTQRKKSQKTARQTDNADMPPSHPIPSLPRVPRYAKPQIQPNPNKANG